MPNNLTPRVDIVFKKLFGVEENKDLLISLINSIVSKEDQVVDVTLLNPYNAQNFKNEKLSILDIKARSHTGKQYNIEIQISDEADYDKRALYYWAELYTKQLQNGVDYSGLNKAIGIHILNFTSILGTKEYHNVFHVLEAEDHVRYFKNMELHTIELNKFAPCYWHEELQTLLARIKTPLDRWVAFLTCPDSLEPKMLPTELDDPYLKKAAYALEVMIVSKAERDFYEDRLKWLRIQASTIKKSYNDGMKEGRKEREKCKAVLVAQKMLLKGLDVPSIAKMTALSIGGIEALKNDL